jgi:hypothetical protein
MNKRTTQKLNTFISNIKQTIIGKCEAGAQPQEIIRFVNEINTATILDELNTKRGRVKNSVPHEKRCIANRANGEQCSRTKKSGCEYCGTHVKGIPHGVVAPPNPQFKSVDVWAEDIGGIVYYIDATNNVYKSEDIMSNKTPPRVIAQYKVVDGVYHLE